MNYFNGLCKQYNNAKQLRRSEIIDELNDLNDFINHLRDDNQHRGVNTKQYISTLIKDAEYRRKQLCEKL